MPRPAILLAVVLAASAARAETLDTDLIARNAVFEAESIYLREGMNGLGEAFEACLKRTSRAKTAKVATACAATGWTMVYLDLLAIDALHVPPSVDVERTSARIGEAMASVGLPLAEANRLRPYVMQFVGTRTKGRGAPVGNGRHT